jgi:diguanylate cyclase (GGDEF)-like protein
MGWPGMGVWHGPSVIGVYQTQPEKEQAVFRTTLGSIALLIYFAFSVTHLDRPTRITLVMMALYVLFGALTWLAVHARPATSLVRLTFTTIIDQGMAITALALGGRAALPLLFIVFWFLVGTGCRYGKRPLMLSCTIAVAGVAGLMAWEPWWILNRQVGVGLLLSIVSTSFYLFVLVNKLERRAATDPLTGLLNRSSLEHAVSQVQAAIKPQGGQLALLVIDLDGFKEVNDSFGHAVGDELLQHFAHELVRTSRRGDAVARLGGDEFVVFARQIASRTDAGTIANRIHAAIESIRFVAGQPVLVSASIGVCLLSEADRVRVQDVGQVIQMADRAMYAAKSRGRSQTVFADELL